MGWIGCAKNRRNPVFQQKSRGQPLTLRHICFDRPLHRIASMHDPAPEPESKGISPRFAFLLTLHCAILFGAMAVENWRQTKGPWGGYLDLFASRQQWKIFREIPTCVTPEILFFTPEKRTGQAPWLKSSPSSLAQPTRELALLSHAIESKTNGYLESYVGRWCKTHDLISSTPVLVSHICGPSIHLRTVPCA